MASVTIPKHIATRVAEELEAEYRREFGDEAASSEQKVMRDRDDLQRIYEANMAFWRARIPTDLSSTERVARHAITTNAVANLRSRMAELFDRP